MTGIVIGVHVVVSFLLILLILLHSGRGGGLSDLFGGTGSVAAGSTVVERNLDRITIAVAVIFTFTTVSLAMRLS
ncbi:MAG TPA: preprotein translocase subunit SecG [Acidimicrobiales bacterium]|nr:preprotein translocase subunit SecG [Acidimicrobiales bacterium]